MDIKLDIHTHSIASGHGTFDTIASMAKTAAERGLEVLGISDHGPATMAAGTTSYFNSLHLSPRKRAGVEILHGVELNILDYYGTVDLPDEILKKLDYAIASIHSQNLTPGTKEQNTSAYIGAMRNPYVKIIGHCDDIKYPIDYKALVEAAKEYHILLELNEASLAPGGYRGDTRDNNFQMLARCKEYKQPILLSSDSHGKNGVGLMPYAEKFLQETDFPHELIYNNRINLAKKYLVTA